MGPGNRINRRPDALSGGEQQRVAIAVALANDPTGELDSDSGPGGLELFRHLVRERGKTAVIATHEARIGDYVDQVLRMVDGKIVS